MNLEHITAHDDGLSVFFNVRPRLFGIASRMLGSAAEAEDVVQDVWLRWQSTNRSVVENPPAYLATATTRLCINLSQSAHSRRETYFGTWLPEPVDTSDGPGLGAERHEALRLAVLVLLERLSPTARASYVLREAFDYSYRQIADILQTEEANVRQLVSRARKHLTDGRSTSVSSGEQRRFLDAFIAASQEGDMAALEGLFAEDIIACSDGGALGRGARVQSVPTSRYGCHIPMRSSVFTNARGSSLSSASSARERCTRKSLRCRSDGRRRDMKAHEYS